MATTSTPEWSAARSGLVGDASAISGSAQINQLLGTHAADLVFPGNQILTPNGTGGFPWAYSLATNDMDQSFTLSGTTIGRVRIPVLAIGDGADLLVSLCADSSGLPGTVITQTRIPASWITQLSAVTAPSVPSSQTPTTTLTGNPLAGPEFNGLHLGSVTTTPWPYPFVASTAAPSATYYDGYIIQVGGVASGATISNVYTVPYSASGVLSPAIPQASFATSFDGSGKMCVATDPQSGAATVVIAGGSATFGGAPDALVYTSSLNPATGDLSAWSTQTSLPTALQNQGAAAYNGYVYMVGGLQSGIVLSSVYYAQVSNGQISAWNTAIPLPTPVQLPFAVAASGFLFVIGGEDAGFVPRTSVYYAPINADGSLGAWLTGPSLPAAFGNLNETPFANDRVVNVVTDQGNIYSLAMTEDGPAAAWQQQNFPGWLFTGYTDNGDGTVGLFGLNSSSYNFAVLYSTPMISVPLPASGLTSGSTYHVLMQQQGGDLNDYLNVHNDFSAFPGNPPAFSSPRGAYTWTQRTVTAVVPIEVYDASMPVVPQLPLHTWEDGGARVTTVVCATTPDHRLLGLCEATRVSNAQNSNTGFESGIAPWTVTGGTVTQSTTQVFEGEFSAQVTPSGSDPVVYLQSEMLPCMPGQQVTAEARMWFTAAVTSASVSINWYTLAGTYISTSSNNVSVPAATWADLANTFTAPAAAYRYTVNPALSGTPAASNVFYVDMVRGYLTTVGPQLSTVTALTYPGNWPGPTWPPLGATVLA